MVFLKYFECKYNFLELTFIFLKDFASLGELNRQKSFPINSLIFCTTFHFFFLATNIKVLMLIVNHVLINKLTTQNS